jgi:hypothetical protein
VAASGLPDGDAILAFAAAQGRRAAGPRWEVYGHPGDDPSGIEIEIFYLLS